MNKRILGLFFILLISNISAVCNEGQIDINTASAEDLDKLSGIGSVYAQRIIEGRLFSSLDDLIKIKGIGNTTLNKIKEEGLACVDEETEEFENKTEFIDKPKEEKEITIKYEEVPKQIELTPIILNPHANSISKSIKSEDVKRILEGKLPFYGLLAIGFIFGALLLLKNRKNKNEFR